VNKAIILFAASVLFLSGAIVYYAQTGRYQITSAGGPTGVYRVDTRTGNVSICSPLNEKGCVSLDAVYKNIKKRKKNTETMIQDFTRENTNKLRETLKKISPPDNK